MKTLAKHRKGRGTDLAVPFEFEEWAREGRSTRKTSRPTRSSNLKLRAASVINDAVYEAVRECKKFAGKTKKDACIKGVLRAFTDAGLVRVIIDRSVESRQKKKSKPPWHIPIRDRRITESTPKQRANPMAPDILMLPLPPEEFMKDMPKAKADRLRLKQYQGKGGRGRQEFTPLSPSRVPHGNMPGTWGLGDTYMDAEGNMYRTTVATKKLPKAGWYNRYLKAMEVDRGPDWQGDLWHWKSGAQATKDFCREVGEEEAYPGRRMTTKRINKRVILVRQSCNGGVVIAKRKMKSLVKALEVLRREGRK